MTPTLSLSSKGKTCCSQHAYVKRNSNSPYFVEIRKGTPTPQPYGVWTDRPWECGQLTVEFAKWFINGPGRDEPGVHAVICLHNVKSTHGMRKDSI